MVFTDVNFLDIEQLPTEIGFAPSISFGID